MRGTRSANAHVANLCRAAVGSSRGRAFLANLIDAVGTGAFPQKLAGEFLIECALREPRIVAPAPWEQLEARVCEVLWSARGVSKYRFRGARADKGAKETLFFVAEFWRLAKEAGSKSAADDLTNPKKKWRPSASLLDAARETSEQLARSGLYRPGHNGIFWASRYLDSDSEADFENESKRSTRATRLRNELGLSRIGKNDIAVEVKLIDSLGCLVQNSVVASKPTFAEGFDTEVFRQASDADLEQHWGRAVDLAKLCTPASESCDGRPEIVLSALPRTAELNVVSAGFVKSNAHPGLSRDEFLEECSRRFARSRSPSRLVEEAIVICAMATKKQRPRVRRTK